MILRFRVLRLRRVSNVAKIPTLAHCIGGIFAILQSCITQPAGRLRDKDHTNCAIHQFYTADFTRRSSAWTYSLGVV